MTPSDRHEGRDKAILANLHSVYRAAKKGTTRRWTGETTNWTPIGNVTLNPEKSSNAA